LTELQEFCKNSYPTYYFTIQQKGTSFSTQGKCGTVAYEMRNDAMKIGKFLSVQAMPPSELKVRFPNIKNPDWEYHAVCMAKIGNFLYCIDPQTDDIVLCYEMY